MEQQPSSATPPPVLRTSSTLVTFLLADIRGYTHFAAQHGDQAAADLSEYFLGLCQQVIPEHGGEVFGSAGDQALTAFSSAHAALHAALALQARLRQEQALHPDLPLMAGIGMDTGESVRVGSDYRSSAVNLAARLCALAAPGDIFASQTVVDVAHVVEDLVPVDRGEVMLKGFDHAVRVIQMFPVGTDPSEVPPLQPLLATHPTNLPDAPTPFIGREREIREVTELLDASDVRLVTLTGPGGTGKTRLALQVGAALLHNFPDGVFFVDLAPLSNPTLVLSTIASVLAVQEAGDSDLLSTVTDQVRDRHLLLILDNFEHLLAASSVVPSLLNECRKLHALVTSRIPLHMSREQEYPVPSLSVPDLKHLPDPEALSGYEAVALFRQRARAVKPGFAITAVNAAAVAGICAHLDGLPLALELAAARTKFFPPQALLQRLDQRLSLLTGGARDRPTRQQTLRNTIDWSYSLLSSQEQILFARLSVFSGGCTFEAAEAVCNPDGDLDLLEGMGSLVDKSLLRQEGEDEPHFRMLETIREYGRERLHETDEAEGVQRLHTQYFLALAQQAQPNLGGLEQITWLERLEAELDNLRTVLRGAQDRHDWETGLQVASALSDFWHFRTHLNEGRAWLQTMLVGSGDVSIPGYAEARTAAGWLAMIQGDYAEAVTHFEHGLCFYQERGDQRQVATGLRHLGQARLHRGEYEQARRDLEQGLAMQRELGDERAIGISLVILGQVAEDQGDYALARELGEEALVLSRGMGIPTLIAGALQGLSRVATEERDYERAQSLLRESLLLNRQLGDEISIGECLDALAEVDLLCGRPVPAARLLGAGEVLRETVAHPIPRRDQPRHERMRRMLRAQLDQETRTRAWAAGRALTMEQAIAEALDEGGSVD